MTYPLTTTLNRIFACDPCSGGKQLALQAAGKTAPDDEPITYVAIVEAVGLDNALWCARAEPQHAREWRLFAVWCARQVQHLMADQRSIDALGVAERFANGDASAQELAAAQDAAWDAQDAAWAAQDAAWDAARAAQDAAWAAQDAAWDAARYAARYAARDAARYAAWYAAWAAQDAAWDAQDAARYAAWDAARDAQRHAFIQMVTTGELP